MNSIEVKNINKKYKDFALENVSFVLPQGSIMGFIGENGAGKTTTLKAILNIINIDSGEISIYGNDWRDILSHEDIGFVFEECCFGNLFKIRDVSRVMKGIYKNWDTDKFIKYTERFSLPLNKNIKNFSRGMKMKLSISIALSHNPKLLILDEATSGLDPVVRNEILEIFQDFIMDETHSILVSSHITSDLEKIADYITFIHNGKICFCKSKDEIMENYAVAKCSESDFKRINLKYIDGYHKNKFGCEVLINNKNQFLKLYSDIALDAIKLDDIMIYYKEGDKKCGD